MLERTSLLPLGLITLMALPAAASGDEMPSPSGRPARSPAAADHDGARDFDFLVGRWTIHNRRLRERLRGSDTWDEFEATGTMRIVLDGMGNEDEFRTEYWPGFVGLTLRFYDPVARQWSLYWVDNRVGILQPPVVGSFSGDVGLFEGDDIFDGRPIRVRFTWYRDEERPRWEQAFSADGGESWETNWTMEMVRPDNAP